MMKIVHALLLSALLLKAVSLNAEEGMWPPAMLAGRIAEMQRLGLKLSAEDIYSVNHGSLKDAIVQFGGGCTGVLVSADGLLLTNHHCGFGSIQKLSSMEHDYLTNGFWAASRSEELPNPGLSVTFMISMEDVTTKVLEGISRGMTESERAAAIRTNTERIEKESSRSGGYDAKIRPFFNGNQYFLFLSETFRDVRLVGAPPVSIGSFGGDTDNWAWPRHTGDFSVFRIYASRDNKPAAYSTENVPYHPRKFLSISLKGPKKGDFTMVFGFPGSTREYLTSCQVDLIAFTENPLKVQLREKRLDVIEPAMQADPRTRIQYASKRAGIANGWKKMMGETRGVKRLGTVKRKADQEAEFINWAGETSERSAQYKGLTDLACRTIEKMRPCDVAGIYISEGIQGVELIRFAGSFKEIITISNEKNPDPSALRKAAEKMGSQVRTFFKDYSVAVDKKVAAGLFRAVCDGMPEGFMPEYFSQLLKENKSHDLQFLADKVVGKSVFSDSARLLRVLRESSPKSIRKLASDPAWKLAFSSSAVMDKKINPVMTACAKTLDSIQRLYIMGMKEAAKDRQFYPDANSTIRISYGQVDDYQPADAVEYRYYTTAEGILEKENPSVYDYRVEPRLRDLITKKDYGRYADADGSLHVAFTASNHTSGGNSGSPVLDGQGRLIGLNFDRNWEGTMSDIQYDPSQCRNIVLDIRYCLFIIDRFASAGRLLEEMKIDKQ
jgi:hypothetical protein